MEQVRKWYKSVRYKQMLMSHDWVRDSNSKRENRKVGLREIAHKFEYSGV
jgi:hypothetical protein